ncbi:hypothetical protein PROFUN_04084 [Planoprotostelium fungivorum]|uniref:Uncharacterized protein n=1 Tax=Planoprotostelium fungivorum TaxID=1890364 RepID=A0A2P6NJF1_9EUKA|nr:hypothetical protein PROFUN_04084 [Planoprotostelium fungivorum]
MRSWMALFVVFCCLFIGVNAAEYEGMNHLYQDNNGANWKNPTGWKVFDSSSTFCSGVYGVSCNSGAISTINLDSNGLTGIINNVGMFTPGLVSFSVASNQLTDSGSISNAPVTYVNMSYNRLTGMETNLLASSSIQTLDLSRNLLTGIGNVYGSNLKYLDISHNAFTSPPGGSDGCSGATSLVYYDMSNNPMSLTSCTTKFPASGIYIGYSNITSLQGTSLSSLLAYFPGGINGLDASYNSLTGDLITLLSVTSTWKTLILRRNSITLASGNSFTLSGTQVFDVNGLNLQGRIDASNAPNLVRWDMANTGVRDVVFPSSYSSLQYCDLSGNILNSAPTWATGTCKAVPFAFTITCIPTSGGTLSPTVSTALSNLMKGGTVSITGSTQGAGVGTGNTATGTWTSYSSTATWGYCPPSISSAVITGGQLVIKGSNFGTSFPSVTFNPSGSCTSSSVTTAHTQLACTVTGSPSSLTVTVGGQSTGSFTITYVTTTSSTSSTSTTKSTTSTIPPTTSSTISPTKAPTTSSTTSSTKAPTTSSTTSSTKAPTTSSTTSSTKAPTTSSTTSSTKAPTTSSTTSSTKAPTTSTTSSTTKASTVAPVPTTNTSTSSTTEAPSTTAAIVPVCAVGFYNGNYCVSNLSSVGNYLDSLSEGILSGQDSQNLPGALGQIASLIINNFTANNFTFQRDSLSLQILKIKGVHDYEVSFNNSEASAKFPSIITALPNISGIAVSTIKANPFASLTESAIILGDIVGASLLAHDGSEIAFNPTTFKRSLSLNSSTTVNITVPIRDSLPLNQTVVCLWWEFVTSSWKPDGCDTIIGNTSVTCSCDHLTNFTIGVPQSKSNTDTIAVTDGSQAKEAAKLNMFPIIVGCAAGGGGLVLFVIVLVIVLKKKKSSYRHNATELATSTVNKMSENIPQEHLSTVEVLGEDTYSTLYLASYGIQGYVGMREAKPSYEMRVASEIAILRNLHHPSIVRFLGVTNKSSPCIVHEWPNVGTLRKLLQSTRISSNAVMDLVQGILSALVYLHHEGIVHGCITPHSVVVQEHGSGFYEAKLSNFIAAKKGTNGVLLDHFETRYAAPEVLQRNAPTAASDIWSFGVLLWVMESRGEVAYSDLKDHMIARKVIEGYRLSPPDTAQRHTIDTMTECFKEPVQRPQASRIYEMMARYFRKSKMQTRKKAASVSNEEGNNYTYA